MTNRDASTDFDPKHRIIGAVVVVALAVIFVPMVLGEREAPAPGVAPLVAAPSAEAENKVAVTRVPPPASATAAVAPSAVPPAGEPESAAPPPQPAAPAKAAGSAEAKTVPGNGWVVQVGTFANARNATRLEQKLKAEGQPVRAERVSLSSGKAVRLRVGPFRERAAALKAQERIQKDVGIKGVVLAYP